MRTYAVVVNWNGGRENLDCIQCLLDEGLTASEVIFVDNASADGSLEDVEATYPDITVLRNEKNQGYGHGSNRGIDFALGAGAEAVLLINNDLVLEPGSLSRLERELVDAPELGIVGPLVVYKEEPERVWAAGGRLTFRQNLTTLLGHREYDVPRWQHSADVDYVPGCAMLVRRAVFERVGVLDGDFFAYHEDVDFCMRTSSAGFGIRLVGEVTARHTSSAATGGGYSPRRKYMMGVNTIWFLRRHGTPTRWLRFVIYDVVSLPFVWLVELARGRQRGVLAKGLGMVHGALGRRVTAESIRPGASRLW